MHNKGLLKANKATSRREWKFTAIATFGKSARRVQQKLILQLQNCLPGHLLGGNGDQSHRQGVHLEQLHLPSKPLELAGFYCHTLRHLYCIIICVYFFLGRESFMISKKVSPSPSCRLPHFLCWARQPGRTQNLQGSQGPQDGFHNARLNSHPKHLTWKLNLSAPSRPNISEPRFFNPFLRFCHLLLLVIVDYLKEFSN